MFTVTVITTGAGEQVVRLSQQHAATAAVTEDKGPSPIAPEIKELAWGSGAFIVLFVAMRFVLYPRLKQGVEQRYGKIRGDHESADSKRNAARHEVADYEAQLATVKAEAAKRIEAVRLTIETERAAAIGAANERIAAERARAQLDNEAARAAAAEHIKAAVVDVSGRAVELATGRKPNESMVDDVVTSLMGART